MAETIKIKYLNDLQPRLGLVDKDSSEWIDLYTAEEVSLKAFHSGMVSLGVAMQLPEGFEAIIAPRSSMFKKYHVLLTNSIGIIDNAYSGDDDWWQANILACEDTVIPAGTRLLQFRLQPTMQFAYGAINFETVDHLGNPSRGGFGSTGIN